eukprot:9932507-Alexandrium_andersonii.AAC.1
MPAQFVCSVVRGLEERFSTPPKQKPWHLHAIHFMEPQTDMVDAIKKWVESAGLEGVTRAPSRSALQGELA